MRNASSANTHAPDESESGNKLVRRAKESKDLVLHDHAPPSPHRQQQFARCRQQCFRPARLLLSFLRNAQNATLFYVRAKSIMFYTWISLSTNILYIITAMRMWDVGTVCVYCVSPPEMAWWRYKRRTGYRNESQCENSTHCDVHCVCVCACARVYFSSDAFAYHQLFLYLSAIPHSGSSVWLKKWKLFALQRSAEW